MNFFYDHENNTPFFLLKLCIEYFAQVTALNKTNIFSPRKVRNNQLKACKKILFNYIIYLFRARNYD